MRCACGVRSFPQNCQLTATTIAGKTFRPKCERKDALVSSAVGIAVWTHAGIAAPQTFTRWCNVTLRSVGRHIGDDGGDRGRDFPLLTGALKDGLNLIALVELLSKKKVPRHNKHPRIPMQKMENCEAAGRSHARQPNFFF